MTHHFVARVKKSSDDQFYAVLVGLNHEVVFTQETRKSKSGIVSLLQDWFPGVEIRDETGPIPKTISSEEEIKQSRAEVDRRLDIDTRVRQLIGNQIGDGIAVVTATAETTFNDLGFDSLDAVEFMMAVEEEFKIEIPDNAQERITRFGQLTEFLVTRGRHIPL